MPKPNNVSRRRPLLLVFILLFGMIPFTTASAWTPSSPGTVNTFENGNTTINLSFPSPGTDRSINFSVPRNTTVMDAFFDLEVNGTDTDLGPTRIDIGEDGNLEWAFDDVGYGSLGVQRTFTAGAEHQIFNITPSSHIGASLFLPSSAIPSNFSLNLSYQTNGFSSSLPITNFSRIALGDVSGDGIDDILTLVTNATVWNGTKNWQQRAVKWLNSSANHNSSSLSFEMIPICNGTDEIIPANLSGDARKEIIGLSTTTAPSCVVEWNGTAWEVVDERVLASNASAWLTIDHDGDGQEQLLLGNTTTTMGYGMGADNLHMYNWSNATNQLSLIAQEIADHTLTGGTTVVSGLAYGNFFCAAQPCPNGGRLAVSDLTNSLVKFYEIDPALGLLVSSINPAHTPIAGISTNLRSGNLDADPWDDLYGTNASISCFAFYNPMDNTFTSVNQTGINLTNVTIDDYNHTGRNQMYVPSKGMPDGNPATMDGELQIWDLPNSASMISKNTTVLNPHTAPLHVLFADVNGDGGIEHITISAEGTPAIHIKHHAFFGIDIDFDQIPDAKDMAYAPNGTTTNLWIEFNGSSHSSLIRQRILGAQTTPTGYGYDISRVEFVAIGTGIGTINASNLFIPYEADFNVSINPGVTSALASALNLEMEVGADNVSIPIPITVARAGNLTVLNPYVSYVLGAPTSLNLPEPPLMVLIDNQWNLTHVEWTTTNLSSSGGLFFTNFEIQVTKNNTTTTYITEYVSLNHTLDVNPMSNYSLRIRTVFEGLRTNWSGWLNYSTPEQPDTFPPPLIKGLVARDRPRDLGDGIDVQFKVNPASDSHTYFVYVADSSSVFTTTPWSLSEVMALNHSAVENDTHVNLTVYNTSAIVNETGVMVTPSSTLIADNTYYIAIITNDSNDNRLFPPSWVGPVNTISNLMNGTLSVSVVGSPQQSVHSWDAFAVPTSHPTLRIQASLDEVEHSLNRTIRLLSARSHTCTSLCINEIMANPKGPDTGMFPNGEWVELHNPGPEAVNLENWTLVDAAQYSHPIDASSWIGFSTLATPYVLESGAYALIAENDIGTLKLNNNGETLLLKNGTGSIIHNVTTGQASEGTSSVPDPSGSTLTWVKGAESTPGSPDVGTAVYWTGVLNDTGVLDIPLNTSTAVDPVPFGEFSVVILMDEVEDEVTGRTLFIPGSVVHFNRTLDVELFVASTNPHQLIRGTTSDIVVGVKGNQGADIASSLLGQGLILTYTDEAGSAQQIQSTIDSMGRATFPMPEDARGQASITLENPPAWLNSSPSTVAVTLIEASLELITTPELVCPIQVWQISAYQLDDALQRSLTCTIENADDVAYPFTLENAMMTVATDGTITVSSTHSTLPAHGSPIDLEFEFDTPLAGIMVDDGGLWANFTFTLEITGPYHISRTIDYTIQIHVTPPELTALHVTCDTNVSGLSDESSIQDLTCTIINTNGVSVTFTGRPSGIAGTPSAHIHSSLPIGVPLSPGYPGMILVLKISVPAETTITTLPIHFTLESRATGWVSIEQSVELTIDVERPQEEEAITQIDTNDTVNSTVSDVLDTNISLNGSDGEQNESAQINASTSVNSTSASQSAKVAGIGMAALLFILIGLSSLLNSLDREDEYDEDEDDDFGGSYVDFDDMDIVRSSQSLSEAKKKKEVEKPLPLPDEGVRGESGGDARARLARRSQKARESQAPSISEPDEDPAPKQPEPVPSPEVEEIVEDETYTDEDETYDDEDEAYDDEEDDDVILDEDGVEWWEDEDGAWYFRDETMDDWEVFEGEK